MERLPFPELLFNVPPILRRPMVALPWGRKREPQPAPSAGLASAAIPDGRLRRAALALLVIVQTWFATGLMIDLLPPNGPAWLQWPVAVLFSVLFAWVSAGFWTGVIGFLVLVSGRDRGAVTRGYDAHAPIPREARTAIVMPICNEHVATVFAGLRATWESLALTGQLDRFDFYVLSDSADPDTRAAETAAWNALRDAVGGHGRIFYRWRKHRMKRKSGNVADFCRRWGAHYRYMVVFDADSVMTGSCLTALVRMMEAHPDTGIIQSAPHASGRDTLHARVQQFAARLYGPLFMTGMHFWQLGESHYWGHNAIIRVAPFIDHCSLSPLPGKGPLSGHILSHDFVEAALMRRAGWKVRIAYDLPGSYEQFPPNLDEELGRDRRWCQGNLQNFRLIREPGLHPVHRTVFLTGAMAYASAPLWLGFMLLTTALLFTHGPSLPSVFLPPDRLFPDWNTDLQRALGLFGLTAAMLYLPKLLAVALVLLRGHAARFGGASRLTASALLEFVMSMLLAPVRMMFHARFVIATLLGRGIDWRSPSREDAQTSWLEATRRHGAHTAVGLGWGAAVLSVDQGYMLWIAPIVGGLILSIPMSVAGSLPALGRRLRERGLFLIPEERRTPRVLRAAVAHAARAGRPARFVDAVIDPAVHEASLAAVPPRPPQRGLKLAQRKQVIEAALVCGPQALSSRDRMALLDDPNALGSLRMRLVGDAGSHPGWFQRPPVQATLPPAGGATAARLPQFGFAGGRR